MRPFISLCMIVKDEEKVLERCLNTVAHLVNEIIIVDTGSIDTTKEIAKRFTDKVYDFEWINDFSKARNFAASKANGKWILVLDADEYVEEENFNIFINELKNDQGKFNAYAINIINFIGVNGERTVNNQHERVYLNDGNIEYTRRIHEQLTHKTGGAINLKGSQLSIYHSGYLNQTVKDKDKQQRNTKLLDRQMKEENNRAFDYFNYGNQSFSAANYEEALGFYTKAYDLKENYQLSWVGVDVVNIVNCLVKLNRYREALDIINDAQLIYETAPDFLYLKAEIYYQRGQYEEAKRTLKHIIDNRDYYSNYISGADVQLLFPSKLLGEIYYQEYDYNQAIFYYTSVLNISRYDKESIYRTLEILKKFHSAYEISEFILSKGLIDRNNLTQFIMSCFQLGELDLAEQILIKVQIENKLLMDILEIKKSCLDEECREFFLKNEERWDIYLQSGALNWIDIYLINKKVSNKIVKNTFIELNKDENYRSLVNLLDKKQIENIASDIIVESLKSCLIYNLMDLARELLVYIIEFKKEISHKVASILQDYNYKVEAMEMYEVSDWEKMSLKDFKNIIENMLSINEINTAVQIATYAKTRFADNFIFYKVILQHGDEELKESIKKDVERYFGNIGL